MTSVKRAVRLLTTLAGLLLLGLCVTPPALAAKRVALVIGNNAYTDVSKLEKAVGDAQAISTTLRGLGFDVITVTDAGRSRMARALVDFETRISPGDTAVFFFAGHGVALDGGKMVYLTSGAALSKKSAQEHGVGWDTIRAALGKARGRVVVFLDACHSGHVSTDLIAPNEALAQELSSEGRSGVLVFAAARGSELSYEVPVGRSSLGGTRGLELAWEGKPPQLQGSLAGGHGLFTSALLEALAGQAPDADRSGAVEVGELVDYVTDRVREASNGQQTPWVVRREMFGDFVVAPAAPK